MTHTKIVPIEPNKDMLIAGFRAWNACEVRGKDSFQDWKDAYQAMIAAAPDTQSQEIERLRADNAELEKEAVWIRNKLGLPSDVKLLSGDITLAGTMHKIVSHAKGYAEGFKYHLTCLL